MINYGGYFFIKRDHHNQFFIYLPSSRFRKQFSFFNKALIAFFALILISIKTYSATNPFAKPLPANDHIVVDPTVYHCTPTTLSDGTVATEAIGMGNDLQQLEKQPFPTNFKVITDAQGISIPIMVAEIQIRGVVSGKESQLTEKQKLQLAQIQKRLQQSKELAEDARKKLIKGHGLITNGSKLVAEGKNEQAESEAIVRESERQIKQYFPDLYMVSITRP